MELKNTPIDCETDTWQPLAVAAARVAEKARPLQWRAEEFQVSTEASNSECREQDRRSSAKRREAG